MNYEEKYKEALGWMRSIYPTMQGVDKEDAEHYFPELKESEDERIRKGLIKGLSAMRDIHKHQTFSDDAINIDDAIAWLEKQGEKSWSEEDEKNYQILQKIICDSDMTANLANKLSDWLKSLKPRWKPTEEQMEALRSAMDFVISLRHSEILESLYNDLKSL